MFHINPQIPSPGLLALFFFGGEGADHVSIEYGWDDVLHLVVANFCIYIQ